MMMDDKQNTPSCEKIKKAQMWTKRQFGWLLEQDVMDTFSLLQLLRLLGLLSY